MYTNFMFLGNGEAIEKRVRPYELSIFLKSYPEDSCYSIIESVWSHYGLIEDWFNEEEQTWYPGFAMPATAWLVRKIRAEYGPGPLWIKVPAEMLGLVEAAKQPPKRRWRISGKWRKKNSKFHRPWWM